MSVATLGDVQKNYYVSLFFFRDFSFLYRGLMFLNTRLEIMYLQFCLLEVQGEMGKGEFLELKNDNEKLERIKSKDKRNTPKIEVNIRADMRK